MDSHLSQEFVRNLQHIQDEYLKHKSHETLPETAIVPVRALLNSLAVARKRSIKIEAPPELLLVIGELLRCQLPTVLAIQATRLDCLARIYFHSATVDGLLSQSYVDEFKRMCLLYGVVDCLPYASDVGVATAIVGQEILQLMKSYSVLYYYLLKLFRAWLTSLKGFVCNLPTINPVRSEMLLPHSEFLELLNLHWETPQAKDLPAECLAAICEVWKAAQPSTQYPDIVAKMTLTNLAWTSKAKFLILAAVLPYIRFTEVLCEYPDTVYSLTCCLDSNYLLPAGAALFKILAKTLTQQEWQDYCEGVLLDALNHSNRTVQLNAVQYWLPCTSHTSPKVMSEFKERLQNLEPFNWLAYIALLKVMGQMDDQDKIVARQALYHGEGEVRVAALSLLCNLSKRTEPPSADEWALVNEFLLDNLHSDNPQFRLKLLSTMRLFLIRVFESCLHRVNKTGTKESLEADIEHVRQLYDRLTACCLHQGAGYQRKVAGLIAVRYVLQLFGPSDAQAESLIKGSCGMQKRAQLVQLAGERWNWTARLYLDRFTICLLDEVPEVRFKAADILKDFFSSPSHVASGSYIKTLYQQGLELSDSPKFPRSECGAVIMQMLAVWGCGPTVENLINNIQTRFARIQEDFLAGARSAPVHGFIGALALILQVPSYRASFEEHHPQLIQLARSISGYMLDTLSGSSVSNSNVAPSFEEMSQAIDDIVRRHHSTQSAKDSISITVQQQLVLACAWLNLKESANLAVHIATMLLQENDGASSLTDTERAARIEECARVVYQILLRCRHKGAIEAAGEAMGLLCRRLLSSQVESIRLIPRNLLIEYLDRLERTQSGASITRRSAGLVFLVVRIVNSQPDDKAGKDSLLYLTVQRLIRVAQRPVVDPSEAESQADAICDLPQALAMHLLKGLVHDGSLGSALLDQGLLESITRLSIDLFDHPNWSVRNAALQLHGSVIPRLTGSHSNKTTAELFHKLPDFEDFLMAKLNGSSKKQPRNELVSSGLIPTLSLLCRLAPSNGQPRRNDRFSSRLTELLDHPVVQVRSLAARSLLAFVPLYKTKWMTVRLCEEASQLSAAASGTNRLHGHLLTLHEFLTRCRAVALSVEDWQMIREAVSALSVIEQSQPCYYIKLAVLQLFKQLGMHGNVDFFKEQIRGGESVRELLHQHPGFSDWLRLKTELVSNHISLNHMLTAIDHLLPYSNGLDVVEPALRVLKDRLVRLSSSSILANTVTGFVTHYIGHWEKFPSLLPVCLDFVQARGVGALLERGDASLRWYADFFLDKCIEARRLGTATALAAIPAASAVIKEAVEKNIVDGLDDLVTRLTRALLDAAQPEESLDFRLAAVRSLKATGKVLLEIPGKGDQVERNLFLLIFNLAQDEEHLVRHETALFLTEMLQQRAPGDAGRNGTAAPRLDVMSPQKCLTEFAGQIERWFQAGRLIPVVLELLAGSKDDSGPAEGDQLLYEPEARNFFREEEQSILFLVRVARSFAKIGPHGTGASTELQLVEFDVRPLLEEASQILNGLGSGWDESSWLFTRSSETHAVLARLSARLEIIALCWPSWKTDQLLVELQSQVQMLRMSL